MNRKLFVYIATSVDGYIAAPNDDLSFLSMVEHEGEDYGYGDFIRNVDTVILGRRTYDKVLSMGVAFPHSDKDTYVITRTPGPDAGSVKFYTGNLITLVERLKAAPGKNIFCDGGAAIVHALVNEDLVDEFIISVVPVLLGSGIKLFNDGRPQQKLQAVSTRQFAKGLVQTHYRRADSDRQPTGGTD